MPVRRFLFMTVILSLLAGAASAEQFAKVGTFGGQFARIPVDARGEAMGLATTVNPLGATAFWWNPAPLPESDRVMVSYTDRDWPADIEWRPLAIRASVGNVTFGYFWGHMGIDPILVRTAYDPDGNGELIEVGADLHLFSCSADLVPWISDSPSAWVWTLGASARYIHEHLAEATVSTWDADLGSSLAWKAVDSDVFDLRLHGTGMARNLFASEYSYGEVRTALPRYYHFGLGLEAGFGDFWRGQRLVGIVVSHTWRRDLEDSNYAADNEMLGVEMLIGGIGAVRAGHRDSPAFFAEGWSWGVGLQYRFGVWSGIRAAVDYASTDYITGYSPGAMDIWTISAGLDLP